ncbi:MAG: insulinase family protein [Treponemataceae bacterium]|nr:insulinase family protein [Treponemataceae bacterium]
MIREYVLPSLCKLVVESSLPPGVTGFTSFSEETERAPVVAIGVWFNMGSRDEASEENGMTHMVEHMLFKGTHRYSAREIACTVDSLGGVLNAFTERETMALHAVVPTEGFTQVVDIISDVIAAPSFAEGDFAKEKTVIVNELEAAQDDVEEVAYEAFFSFLWPHHSLGYPIGGTIPLVSRFTRDEVYQFFIHHIQNRPAVISVAGAIVPDEVYRVLAEMSSTYEGLSGFPLRNGKEEKGRRSFLTPDPAPGTIGFYELSSQYVQLFYAFPLARTVSIEEYHTLAIANTIIGDSVSSRLFQHIREEAGLCYTIYSSELLFRDCSLLTIYATCSIQDLFKTMDAIEREIEVLRKRPCTAEELMTSRSHLKGMLRISSQDMEYRMRRLGRQALYQDRILSLTETQALIEHTEIEHIAFLVQEFLGQEPLIFVVGPKKIQKLLKSRSASFYEGL